MPKFFAKPVQVVCFIGILALSIVNMACFSNDDLTADEHLEKAFEMGQLQLAKEVHALKAAELGSVCAEGVLASLYQPNDKVIRTNNGTPKRADAGWIGVDEDKALNWSKRFEASLLNLSEQGNATAMFYLGLGHMEISGFAMNHLPQSDSLSLEWLEKAASAGHERSIMFLLMNDLIKLNPERKKGLLDKLAKAGSAEAYRRLSLMYLGGRENPPNPELYFGVIREAVDNGISGVYAWAKMDLDKLEEQAAKGNEASIRYLQIADSLEIRTSLESLPDAGAEIKDPRDLTPKEAFCQGLP